MNDLTLRSLPAEVRDRIRDVRSSGLAVVSRGNLVEARRTLLEVRKGEDGTTRGVAGYATTWGTEYDVYGGPDAGGWVETIQAGAADKSLAERDDTRFLLNHEGLPLARTKSGTMELLADSLGLLVQVASLDMANPRAVELMSALDRGDVDQMSFAFMVMRQEWNGDYTVRTITELKLFDVSAVTYPANPATIIGARSDTPAPVVPGMSLSLAIAMAEAAALR
jgi:HK97 family phage prohead protease